MKRIISVIVSVCLIVTSGFVAVPIIDVAVPSSDLQASAASYPALKKITYKATGNQRKDMVGFAKTQIDYAEKKPNLTYFGAWYGMNRQPWCAMFICWCAAKSGVPKTVLPRLATADRGWAKKQKVYYKSKQWGGKYTPKAGDLIYFSWSVRDYADHIGMVSGTGKKDGVTYVYTIEGNKHDKVKKGSYAINNRYILGYASPKYGTKGPTTTTKTTTSAKYTITFNANGGQNAPAKQTKTKGKTLVLTKEVPTRVGFSFLGWSEDKNATSAKYKAGANFTQDKTTTLFAIWQDNTYQVKITKEGGLPKRSGPGLDYEKKGTLAKDSKVTIVETKNGWGKLSDGCWIMLSFTVEVDKPTTTTKKPTTTTKNTTTTKAAALGVYKTTGDLYKRSGPGKDNAIKGVLKKGSTVTLIQIKNGWGKMADGTWSSMKFMKKIADPTTKKTTTTTKKTTTKTTTKATTTKVVNKNFTVKINPSGGLNMRAGPDIKSKKKGTLVKGKKVTIIAVNGGWGKIKGNNNWIMLKYTSFVSGYKVKVTIKTLNMRKGASKKFDSVGYIKPGTYDILRINSTGEWGKLKTNGKWIMLKYTTRV